MNLLFHNLKNHINRDPLSDWFDKNHKSYRKDKKGSFYIEIEALKRKYKLKFLSYFNDEELYYDNLSHKQIQDALNSKQECIIVGGNIYNRRLNLVVKPDIIIHRNLFLKYFPDVKEDLPEYIIIDILYKVLHFNSKKDNILNEGNIYYHKCKMYAASDGLNIKNKGYFFGKEYRHKNNILPKKETIGSFLFTDDLNQSINDAIDWLKRLEKNYKNWVIYPKPSVLELYPNMNHKSTDWSYEKSTLAVLIKEITYVWNISYNKRCILHDKGIYTWDDPILLSNIYSYKIRDNYHLYIQSKMINLQLQDEIKIEPRRIKKYDFIDIIKNQNNSIILDIESICDMNEKENYFDDIKIEENAKICIIGTILNKENFIFKDFTIKYLELSEEKKIIYYWLNYLKNNLDLTKKIKVYHWGNAEKVYLKYMKTKYTDLIFPDFEMIDLIVYFKKEPIVIKGCFGYGLKEIVKNLYDLKLIDNKWTEDIGGLEAMTKLKEFCQLALEKNIPIKRFSEVKDIIYYNYIDCRVIVDILKLLSTMV